MRNQLTAIRWRKRWLTVMLACLLILPLFSTFDISIKANSGTQFDSKNDAGKFVEMGGRKWVVIDVINDKPYLMMDSIYGETKWNSNDDSSDASEIFQYLEDNFNNIITVAEDRDLIAMTEWKIRSQRMFDQYNEYTTTGSKEINPHSISQKLGLISTQELSGVSNYCELIASVMGDIEIWTRTPEHEYEEVFQVSSSGTGCFINSTSPNNSFGVQPVLYLKDTVRIKGGEGTKENPYVLSVSEPPNVAAIEADATKNTVTIKNVPAKTTVKVYANNGTTLIGSQTNDNSTGTVSIAVSLNLQWNDKVFVSFTEPSKGESNKVEAIVQDNDPPSISLSASPTTPTSQKVTVTVTITDSGSNIAEKKWAQGSRDVTYFRTAGTWYVLNNNTFEIEENGVYTVYAKDAAGNDSIKQMTISNIDKSPPILTDVKITSSNTNTNWAKVGDEIILTFKASKELGTQSTATIAGNNVLVQKTESLTYRAEYMMKDNDSEGTVEFTINYQDEAGNIGTPVTNTTDNSHVQFDKTAPVIQFSQNGNSMPTKTAQSIVSVTDNISGVNTLEYIWTNNEDESDDGWKTFENDTELTLNNPAANGNWYLHVRAKDVVGNESYAKTNAFVLDNTPPVITLEGEAELTIETGSPFIDPGAEATDNIDGNVTDYIKVTGTVDIQTIGTYTIIYTVTDRAGNTSSVTRIVYVEDTKSPDISFSPNGNDAPSKIASSIVTVIDEGSGVDEDSLEYIWTNNEDESDDGWKTFENDTELTLNNPAANGNWYLHVRAKDVVGNESYAKTNAFVLDNTPPVITLNGDDLMRVYRGGSFEDPGAIAEDNIDGDLTDVIVVTGDIDTQTVGTYTLEYTVTDRAGNMTSITRTVNVQRRPSSSAPIIIPDEVDDPPSKEQENIEHPIVKLFCMLRQDADCNSSASQTLKRIIEMFYFFRR